MSMIGFANITGHMAIATFVIAPHENTVTGSRAGADIIAVTRSNGAARVKHQQLGQRDRKDFH